MYTKGLKPYRVNRRCYPYIKIRKNTFFATLKTAKKAPDFLGAFFISPCLDLDLVFFLFADFLPLPQIPFSLLAHADLFHYKLSKDTVSYQVQKQLLLLHTRSLAKTAAYAR